jgi:hypothetical protein
MHELVFTEFYEEEARRFMSRHEGVRGQYEKAIKLLGINPYHPSLKLEKERQRGKDIYSVCINMMSRMAIYFFIEHDQIIPLHIGSHEPH